VAQWQRDVLNEWILTTLDTLEDMGLVDVQLQYSLACLHASYLNIDIDPDSELSPTEQLEEGMRRRSQAACQAASEAAPSSMQSKDDGESIDGEYFDDLEDEIEFNRWIDEQLAGFEDVVSEELHFGSDESDSKEVDPDKHLTLFKTLFHRIARALHPDKETDPEQRNVKQALMSQLLEARRKQDLMSVFDLYQAHVDQDADFSEQDLIELESVLARFITMEEERRVDLIMQSPTHHSVYERFYSKSAKTVTRKINRHIRDTRKMKDRVDTFSQSVTSLKKLKPYLEERYDKLSVYL